VGNANYISSQFFFQSNGVFNASGGFSSQNGGISLAGSISGTSASLNAASTLTLATLTTTPTAGLSYNTGVTTVGTPVRYSPGESFNGHVWNLTTSIDNVARFQNLVKPVSALVPTATLVWQSDIAASPVPVDIMTLSNLGVLTLTNTAVLKSYTVATLPTGIVGMIAYVSDASSPTYGATLSGGGSVKTLAFFDGTNWTSH